MGTCEVLFFKLLMYKIKQVVFYIKGKNLLFVTKKKRHLPTYLFEHVWCCKQNKNAHIKLSIAK